MKTSTNFGLIFIPLVTLLAPNILAVAPDETITSYAVLDGNGQDFLIVNEQPVRDKIVAGAHFTNAINQTG